MNPTTSSLPILAFTRRAARAWWADGLWDLAVAGYLVLLGGWLYILARVMMFPSWTWPWPFLTSEVVNPLKGAIFAWVFALILVSAAYLWLAYRAVAYLKARWLASRQGDVRHAFWQKVEGKVLLLYTLILVGLYFVLVLLAQWLTGGPHLLSMLVIASIASIFWALGETYDLRRYRLASLVGLLVSAGLEVFATRSAIYGQGPQHFFDVSAQSGNPAIPALVWAVVLVCSGLAALANVLRRIPHERA